LKTIAPVCSTTDSGRIRQADANSVQYIERTKWLCMIPFGSPVVPLVYMTLNRSSWLTDRPRPAFGTGS
jgi:hypothetical protein